MTVMSHREAFLKESTATLKSTRRCCYGLNLRSLHRLCVCTFAPTRGMLWGGIRDQDILPSWQTLGTKGGEGRLNPALSSDQREPLPHGRATVQKATRSCRRDQDASAIMLHYDRQKSVSCELKQVLPAHTQHLSSVFSLYV